MNKYIITLITHNNETVKMCIKAKTLESARDKFFNGYKPKKIISIVEKPKVKLSLFNEQALLEEYNMTTVGNIEKVEIKEPEEKTVKLEVKQEMVEHGKEIRKIRNSFRVSQVELSKEMQINKATLARWERAEIVPRENIQTLKERIKSACVKCANRKEAKSS